MVQRSLPEQSMEISPEAETAWLIGLNLALLEDLPSIHWALYFGMPVGNVRKNLASLDSTELKKILDGRKFNQTDLVRLLEEEAGVADEFCSAATQLLEWETGHVTPRTWKTHSAASRDGNGPRQPPWANEPGYQELMESVTGSFRRYLDHLEQGLPTLLGSLPKEADPSLSSRIATAGRSIAYYKSCLENGYEAAMKLVSGGS